MIRMPLLAFVLGALTAAPAAAQTGSTPTFDSRWTPFLGCWQMAREQVDDQAVPLAPGVMVCVRPAGRNGVTVTTTVEGKDVLEETIVADGTAQPATRSGCQGAQTNEWSRDGERLFTRVELECPDRPKRVVSGITQMARGYWVDAQATVIDGTSDVRLRRYQRTSDQFAGGTTPAGAPMSLEDIVEASKKVASPALEAALVEAGGRFTLDSSSLTQLADAGVSPNVIDLMVAQAYPGRFQVERPSNYSPAPITADTMSSAGTTTVITGSAGYPFPVYDPYYYNNYYYSPFAYSYYWGPGYYPYRPYLGFGYGYGYGGYYNDYYGYPGYSYRPSHPGSGGSGGSGGSAAPGSPDSPGGDGVVVNGRGYTRVRPNSGGDSNASPSPRSAPSSRGSRVSGGGSSDSGGSSSGSSSGSSNSGSSSGSGGSISGGGSSGGGRRAQPR